MTSQVVASELVSACLALELHALAVLSGLAAEHPVVQELLALSSRRDRRAVLVFRAIPIESPARQAWNMARAPELSNWFEKYNRIAVAVIGCHLRLVPDRDNFVGMFWGSFCERGLDLGFDPGKGTPEAWVTITARAFSFLQLRAHLRKPRTEPLDERLGTDRGDPLLAESGGPVNTPLFWRRLNRLLLLGRLHPRNALFLLLAVADIAGPSEVAATFLEKTALELTGELCSEKSPVPESTINLLRRRLTESGEKNMTLASLAAASGRPARSVFADWIEEARRVCREDIGNRDWTEVEKLAVAAEDAVQAALSSRVRFLQHSLVDTGGGRLLVWAYRKLLGVPKECFVDFTARRAADELRRRVNSLALDTLLTEADADCLARGDAKQTLGEIVADLPDRAIRSVENEFRDYQKRHAKRPQ